MVNYFSLSTIVGGIGYERVLSWLGFSNITSDSSSVRAPCGVHGGDRKDSFCLYKNTLIWRCFSNKCNEIYGSSFFDLIKVIFKCSFGEAVNKFCDEFAVDKTTFLDGDLDDNAKKDALFLNYLKHTTQDIYNITSIKLDTRPCNYFLSSPPLGGGPFSKKTLSFFNVSEAYTDDFGINRALIPVCDHNGVLAGYSGRDISNKLKQRRYLLIGNITAGNILYNLNIAKNTMSDYIIVVEGFKSVWRLHEYGYNNVVACMGSLLVPHQIRLLIGTLKKIVLFFDIDSAGIQGTIITNNKYNLMLPLIPIISEYDRDPADLTKEEIDKMLSKYRTEHTMLA
jgi:hypothetical protein